MNNDTNLTNQPIEYLVLLKIAINSDLIYKYYDRLSENLFSVPLYAEIYKDMHETKMESGELDLNFFANKYNGREVYINGKKEPFFITQHLSPQKSVMNSFKAMIDLLLDLHQRRQLSQLVNGLIVKVGDFENLETKATDICSELLSQITDITSVGTSNTSHTALDAFKEIYEQVRSEEPFYKAKTGLKLLDQSTNGGLQKSRVYAFQASAKTGKTMLATTISSHLNNAGHKHLFVCAEMGYIQVAHRIAGQQLGVNPQEFLVNKSEDLLMATGRLALKGNDNIIFEDQPSITFDDLKACVEKHVYQSGIEGFVLDYYQLVTGQKRNQSKAEFLEEVAGWVAYVCKKHNIWCVLLAQSNDDGLVLGSRGLTRFCDQQYFMNREKDDNGVPMNNNIWLEMGYSRYTQTYFMGDKENPTLKIHRNGTHLEEVNGTY